MNKTINQLSDLTQVENDDELVVWDITAGTSKKITKSNLLQEVTPVDEVTLNNMHPVTSNAVAESLSYSTTEHATGKTWIDGKPIYRKCYSGSVTSNTQTISHGLGGNISDVIDLKAVIKTSGLFIPAGYYYDNEHNVSVYISGDNFTLLNTYTGGTYRIILEYTKTT